MRVTTYAQFCPIPSPLYGNFFQIDFSIKNNDDHKYISSYEKLLFSVGRNWTKLGTGVDSYNPSQLENRCLKPCLEILGVKSTLCFAQSRPHCHLWELSNEVLSKTLHQGSQKYYITSKLDIIENLILIDCINNFCKHLGQNLLFINDFSLHQGYLVWTKLLTDQMSHAKNKLLLRV